MSKQPLKPLPHAPTKPNRSPVDYQIDMAASALYGTAMGVELAFDGDMRSTACALDGALCKFLEDIAREAGDDVAEKYAEHFIETLVGFVAGNQVDCEPVTNADVNGRAA